VIVNFEIWRRDKDFLGKLIGWQIDSLIVDEAHSIKSTASANFKAIETLVTTSNTCANCKGHIYGLTEPKTRALAAVPLLRVEERRPHGRPYHWPLPQYLQHGA
jgi:hypothetical protein